MSIIFAFPRSASRTFPRPLAASALAGGANLSHDPHCCPCPHPGTETPSGCHRHAVVVPSRADIWTMAPLVLAYRSASHRIIVDRCCGEIDRISAPGSGRARSPECPAWIVGGRCRGLRLTIGEAARSRIPAARGRAAGNACRGSSLAFNQTACVPGTSPARCWVRRRLHYRRRRRWDREHHAACRSAMRRGELLGFLDTGESFPVLRHLVEAGSC